jgi:hypothetical protein
MTTTPIVPIITQSWLKRHERTVIVTLVLLAGSWGYAKYTDSAAVKAEARATVAEQTLVAQQTQNAQFAAQTAQVEQQYQGMLTALAAQNASLAQAVASRQASQKAQQAVDVTLPLPDLANRLKTLGNAPDGSVTTSGVQILLTQSGAVAVTQTLETIPALNADLKDTTALEQAEANAKAQGDLLIAEQGKQIIGLNLASVDASKVCTTQIAAVKAEANKAKRKWFIRGVIVGFIGGLWGGHAGL